MKKISIILFLLSVNVSFAQVSVVSAPVLEIEASTQTGIITQQSAIMSTMNGVITALEKADREYKSAMQKATWLRNLQTAGRILYMVENLVCTSKNLSIRMNSIGHTSCLMTYRFDMSIIKVQQSADYLGIILTAGVTMTPAERMKSLDDVIKAFEEAQEMMVRLNRALDSDIMRLRLASNSAAAADLLMSYDRSGRKK
jgi:glycyl-tRNA synthetase beta subunit